MDRWGRSQMWFHKVFCDVAGRRHLPGICRYLAKCTGHAVNQGGTADKCFVRPWQKVYFCQGRFFWDSFDGRYNVKGVFFFFKGGYDTVFSKRWWRTQRLIILSVKMQISRMISASRWYFHTRAGKENGEYLWRCHCRLSNRQAAWTVWKGRAEAHRRICEENENGSIDQLVVVVIYF